jgi:hypothetical protein
MYVLTYGVLIRTGLPDGAFSNQKSQFGYILEGLGMENVGIPTYFRAICNILRPFDVCYGHWIIWAHFSQFGYIVPTNKNLANPAFE